MKLHAISSIFDDSAGQKRPAAKRYGQIHPFCRQESLIYGRKAALSFLKLNEFGSYLNFNKP